MDSAGANPLEGKRLVITRAAAQSEALAGELARRGATPMVVPLIQFAAPKDFAPLDEAIQRMERFDWLIFTSAQAVRAVAKRSRELKGAANYGGNKLRVAAVGPVSAEAAREAGFDVAFVAETHNGAALAGELGNRLKSCNVLLPRSDRANADLPAALETFGAHVTQVIAYRTMGPSDAEKEKLRKAAQGEADAVLFFSPSAVQEFSELCGSEQLQALQDKLAITAVGPVTGKALESAGVRRFVLAKDTTAGSVIEALEEHFAASSKHAAKLASGGVRRR